MVFFRRLVAVGLIATQSVCAVPADVWAQSASSDAGRDQPPIVVNRTVPRATPPPPRPVFSNPPSDAEILRARVFPEPLVPVGGSTPDDNVALGAALLAYATTSDAADLGPIQRFMESHPQSAWQPALLVNAGMILLKDGYIGRAVRDFEAAWTLAKDDTSLHGRAMADAAIGELLALETRLGHVDRVQMLLDALGDRVVSGAATERVSQARQAIDVMRHHPEEAFRCGPYALAQLIEALVPGALRTPKLMMTRTGPEGSSMAQLVSWANDTELRIRWT
jgi:hypothetical protein